MFGTLYYNFSAMKIKAFSYTFSGILGILPAYTNKQESHMQQGEAVAR